MLFDDRKQVNPRVMALPQIATAHAARGFWALVATAVLVMAGVSGGCGDDRPQINQTDTLDTLSPDTAQSPRSCESNSECRGGEICREKTCRLACTKSEECAGDVPACDLEAGYCVACLTSDDCGSNSACTDKVCAFYCEEHSACPSDSFCDSKSGECAIRACGSSSDCPGGYRCADFVCESIDPIICEAGTTRCDLGTNSVARCNADGTAETSEGCGEGLGCLVEGSIAVCAAVVCEANTLGCDDSQSAFECNSSGTLKTVVACPTNYICDGGVCSLLICTPGVARCDGAGVRVCEADGLSEIYEPCAAAAGCAASPFGCACAEGGSCEERLCRPGATRCAGVGAQTCSPSGFAWEPSVTCPASQSCLPAIGACVATACAPGAKSCHGEVLAVCASNGTSRTTTDCAASRNVCLTGEGGGACQARVCTPDALGCDSAGRVVEACDARGAEVVRTPCPEDEVCSDGTCIAPVGGCPTAVITVAQGNSVALGTSLNLSARDSIAAAGTISRWEWSVTQPSGETSAFMPSNLQKNVTFTVNKAGVYIFRLKVWDSLNQVSCVAATYTVTTIADVAIRVEVVWDTPDDPNQSDTGFDTSGNAVGSDMDLHLLHPNAAGTYFQESFDCFWFNTTPNWGAVGAMNDPEMVLDDTDGAGPEVVLLKQPEDGATYRVGVHYYDDWSFGHSFATIRVFINGELREEWSRVEMVNKDLWDALTIAWPSQTITRITVNGAPKITPNTTLPGL